MSNEKEKVIRRGRFIIQEVNEPIRTKKRHDSLIIEKKFLLTKKLDKNFTVENNVGSANDFSGCLSLVLNNATGVWVPLDSLCSKIPQYDMKFEYYDLNQSNSSIEKTTTNSSHEKQVEKNNRSGFFLRRLMKKNTLTASIIRHISIDNPYNHTPSESVNVFIEGVKKKKFPILEIENTLSFTIK